MLDFEGGPSFYDPEEGNSFKPSNSYSAAGGYEERYDFNRRKGSFDYPPPRKTSASETENFDASPFVSGNSGQLLRQRMQGRSGDAVTTTTPAQTTPGGTKSA